MEELQKEILALKRRIEDLERVLVIKTLKFGTEGTLVIPVLAADPGDPDDGEIWYNSTSDTYKGRENGVTVTFTTS